MTKENGTDQQAAQRTDQKVAQRTGAFAVLQTHVRRDLGYSWRELADGKSKMAAQLAELG